MTISAALRGILPLLPCAFALLLGSCASPPQSDYDSLPGVLNVTATPIGNDSADEACTSQPGSPGLAIYCGGWSQPSAQVRAGGPGDPAALPALASSSPWRAALENEYQCGAPAPGTILGNQPAELLSCTQRIGGWPHAAIVTVINHVVYYGDGVLPALPPMTRAIGVLSGQISAADAGSVAVPVSDAVLAQRLAAQAYSSGDISHYESLMALGAQANQAEDFSSAVIAYRAALALQQEKLGAANPGAVAPMLELALNLSDEGQYPEADSLFAAAGELTPASADPGAAAKLLHYQALNQLNQGHDAAALALLDQAIAAYTPLVPPELLVPQSIAEENAALFSITYQAGPSAALAEQLRLKSPVTQSALLGLIEAWRYKAIALRSLGETGPSEAALITSNQIAASNDLAPAMLDARLERTGALISAADGQDNAALIGLDNAAEDFAAALPGSLPIAETGFLRAAVLHAQGEDEAAISACRGAIGLLKNLRLGTSPALIGPCLDGFAAVADAQPGQAEALHSEMFEAAELAQGSVTAREIGEAAARLSTSASDPKAAAAIRAQQDAAAHLASLYQQRDDLAKAAGDGAAARLDALDRQIAAANIALQQDELAVQAAAPNYGQLVQEVVSARDVLSLLRPDEGFLGVTSTPDSTWLFLLHGGQVNVARSKVNDTRMAALVGAVLTSIQPAPGGIPAFDMRDAGTIYADTLGPFAGQMGDVRELVIAPSGPLLALPFAVLPTAPADPQNLSAAPWLIRSTNLAYVPAAANFVALRKIEGTSAAANPWFGFGDFQPVSLAQAQATYNPASCGESAAEFAALPHLPYAALELQAAAAIFGADARDELLGPDFTVPNVESANLKNFRILHFATHALLPTDLPCQSQPAIVTSAPPNAASADQALLSTGDVTNLHLDADLVLLSACNTGGAEAGGEALSGLARSFFYAGARALMVTQWAVNDQVSAYLVADTLSRIHAGSDGGAAGSLRAAQLALIGAAGKTMPAGLADPFFWAAFAVIGDGGTAPGARLSALSAPQNAGL